MQFLDAYPIWMIIVAFVVITLACYEVGFRIGRWWQERMPGEQEGPTGVLVGAILGLMAFLLAVTMGMASDRFDARRGWWSPRPTRSAQTYLEADYLPQPAADQIKELLREYLPLRIADHQRPGRGPGELPALAGPAHGDVGDHQGRRRRAGTCPDLMSSFGDSLAEIAEHPRDPDRGTRLRARARDRALAAARGLGPVARHGRLQRRAHRAAQRAQRRGRWSSSWAPS